MVASRWVGAVLLFAVSSACASIPDIPRPPWAGPSEAERQEHARVRAAMERAIKANLGKRYRWGGDGRGGIDCSGFNRVVLKAAGVEVPRTAEQQWGVGSSVSRGELQFGDMVFFNTKRFAGSPVACLAVRFCPSADIPWTYGVTHTGIYVGGGKFAHASPTSGVGYARLEDAYWTERWIGARRVLPDFPDDD